MCQRIQAAQPMKSPKHLLHTLQAQANDGCYDISMTLHTTPNIVWFGAQFVSWIVIALVMMKTFANSIKQTIQQQQETKGTKRERERTQV
jgi:hypothetical protein